MTAARHPLSMLRRALRAPTGRAWLCALVLALIGAQLVLQTHAVAHELGPHAETVCAQCLSAKSGAPLPVVPVLALAPPTLERIVVGADAVVRSRAPLTVRSRAPPPIV